MSPPDGATVALETSSRRPSVAVLLGGRLMERALEGERAHASDLLPTLAGLLAELGGEPKRIDAVLVGTGPGSYTGLRVGVATALGLARGAGARLFGLSSLEALAWDVLAPGERAAFLLDARAGELYLARYARTDEGLHAELEPCVTTAARLAELLPEDERVVAERGAVRASGLEAELQRAPTRFTLDRVPGAAAVLELGARRLASEGAQEPCAVTPLYLRAFVARARRR